MDFIFWRHLCTNGKVSSLVWQGISSLFHGDISTYCTWWLLCTFVFHKNFPLLSFVHILRWFVLFDWGSSSYLTMEFVFVISTTLTMFCPELLTEHKEIYWVLPPIPIQLYMLFYFDIFCSLIFIVTHVYSDYPYIILNPLILLYFAFYIFQLIS